MCTCGKTHVPTTAEIELAGASFLVQDMTCAHCAMTIRNALEDGMPGAVFTVDLENQTVTVAGGAARAEAILRDAGYKPALLVH